MITRIILQSWEDEDYFVNTYENFHSSKCDRFVNLHTHLIETILQQKIRNQKILYCYVLYVGAIYKINSF